MAGVRERGESEAAVWVAGVAGAKRPARAVRAERGPQPPLSVGQVAAAVDAGRDLAAAAADDGVAVLITSAPGGDDAARELLAALADDPSRPLRALRTRGTHELGVLCGIALGAGERGLGCVCDGLAALAGAAVAAAIEPPLHARLRALTDHEQAARVGIAAVDPTELEAALD
jgi:NaMN:DMB phosphoribosyltransferase